MKRLVSIVGMLLFLSFCGCASTKGYFVDRGRDVADIFTLSCEFGVGAKVRGGPIALGCMTSQGSMGLRGGRIISETSGYPNLGTYPPIYKGAADLSVFGFFNVESLHAESLVARRKTFHGGRDDTSGQWLQQYDEGGNNPAYYSQIEATVGLGILLKLGFNPGELLDFILGWTTLDVFRDDIGLNKKPAVGK